MNQQQPHQSGNGTYCLDIKDFGPIARASVEVRPLTVFIGPSNTGKSYLAILIYALNQCFGGDRLLFAVRHRISLFNPEGEISPEIHGSLRDWAASLSEHEQPEGLPSNVVAHIRSKLEGASGLERAFTEEIRRCFGIDALKELVRREGRSTQATVNLEVAQKDMSDAVRYEFRFGSNEPSVVGSLPHDLSGWPSGRWLRDPTVRDLTRLLHEPADQSKTDKEDRLRNLLLYLPTAAFTSLFGPAFSNVYYLPADRTGVMHSHQVVVNTLIHNATTAGQRPSMNLPMLSGVLADFLGGLIGMSERNHRESLGELATQLEDKVLKGTVRLDRAETGYPSFAYRPSGWKADLPLMRTSSMVTELTPVVLYLRYLVCPGDVLIIEEPEAHLHPGMQAVFAREIARLIHSGVRVIMTTHSEWFLEQIGNLVRLSSLPENKRKGIVGADVALRPQDVGAWLFKPTQRPKGAAVEEVVLDPETGLFPTDFDLVSETLYNEGAEIFNRLQESKGP